MFTLDATIHAAPISVRAQAMEAKLEFLRALPLQHILNAELILCPEHTAWRTVGPAAAAGPPAAILAAAMGAARVGQRPADAPPRGEPIPPFPPCDRRTLEQLKSQQLTCSPCGRALSGLVRRRGGHY